MSYYDKIKNELVKRGLCSTEKVEELEKLSAKKKLSFAETIISNGLLDYPQLGEILSSISGFPYCNVLAREPDDQAITMISPPCIERWKILPITYDISKQLLSVVIYDENQISFIESVKTLLMEPYSLVFSIATEKEITLAIKKYIRGETNIANTILTPNNHIATEEKKREPMKLMGLHAKMEILKQKGRTSVAIKKPEQEPPHFYSSAEIIKFLINATAMTVEALFKNNPDKLDETHSIARYCQLLAGRLGFSHFSSEKLVLASWMSAFSDKPEILKRFGDPFDIGKIILSENVERKKESEESAVFQLVKKYHELRKQYPQHNRDINDVRRHIKLLWAPSQEFQHILEAFLQILIDEEFIASLSSGYGKLLIVDPEENIHPEISPLLLREGYEVVTASSAEDALDKIPSFQPDLAIVNINLPNMNGEQFCRNIKNNGTTKGITCFLILPQEHHGKLVEYYKAGADEVFIKPLDLELFSLKIHRIITTKYEKSEKIGLTGAIEDINFADMIQIFAAGGKNVEILLHTSSGDGRVYLKEGIVIHAETNNLKGQQAFYEIMRWKKGEFSTRQINDFPQKTINADTISLLMEGARLADEEISDKEP